MLRRLFNFLNRDLTGRTWTEESTHTYFGNTVRFCSKRGDDYWEAELTDSRLPKPFSVTFRGTPVGPTDGEVAFCRSILSDLDATFERCRVSFEPEFVELTKSSLPHRWTDAFSLDGIDLPFGGDAGGKWRLCYASATANRNFTACFDGGVVVEVLVDG
jgi:hypothetical protein